MALPVRGFRVELDGAAPRRPAIEGNGGFREIRPRLAIPDAELNDAHFAAVCGHEIAPELAGEPARLELDLRHAARPGRRFRRGWTRPGAAERKAA